MDDKQIKLTDKPLSDPATITKVITAKFKAVKQLFNMVDSFTPLARSPETIITKKKDKKSG